MTFEIIWTLHNPTLNRTVEAPNTNTLEATSLEDAVQKLGEAGPFIRVAGLKCIGVQIKEA